MLCVLAFLMVNNSKGRKWVIFKHYRGDKNCLTYSGAPLWVLALALASALVFPLMNRYQFEIHRKCRHCRSNSPLLKLLANLKDILLDSQVENRISRTPNCPLSLHSNANGD